jgi:SAM-dependent methyltransferase
MFAPPDQLRGAFDVACSFGLVEHFRPTESAISAVAQFCKPGGYVLTTVPNLRGLPGALQTRINRAVYDFHVPLSPDELATAHTRCGLEVIESGPIGTLNLMVLNFSGDGSHIPEIFGLMLAASISGIAWSLHRLGLAERPSPMTSPYLGCLARVPA